ncbi:MAG: hypothetical protein ABIG64_07825 [Candidatus Omnitrophota bacterium]
MKSGWIEHKGKKIFMARYNDFNKIEQLEDGEILFVTQTLIKEPEKSVLLLVDVRNSPGTPRRVDSLKDSALKLKNIIRKTAIVGVLGIKKILLNAVITFSGMELHSFEDIEAAKEWLVSEQKGN